MLPPQLHERISVYQRETWIFHRAVISEDDTTASVDKYDDDGGGDDNGDSDGDGDVDVLLQWWWIDDQIGLDSDVAEGV